MSSKKALTVFGLILVVGMLSHRVLPQPAAVPAATQAPECATDSPRRRGTGRRRR